MDKHSFAAGNYPRLNIDDCFSLCGIFTFPAQQYQHSRKAQVRVNTDGNVSAQGDEFIFIPCPCYVRFSFSEHPTSVKAGN